MRETSAQMPRPVQQSSKLFAAAAAVLLAVLPATAQTAPQRPPITGIAHIALRAKNMAADRAFYTHTLGWQVVPSPEYPNALRFYGDPRQSVDVRPIGSPTERAFDHVAFATTNAKALLLYLKSKGVTVPHPITRLSTGEQYFRVTDPEGNIIEFVQRAQGARSAKSPDSISNRIIHAGFIVHSAAAEDRFFKDILGFHLYWMGGMKDGVTDFVSMQVPDGTDWIEYMLNSGPNPSHHQLGVDNHFSLGVPDMDQAIAKLRQHGWAESRDSKKQMGRDGKVQLNLYDPDETRVEFMEFAPRQTPCCHPITGKQPGLDH